MKFENKTLDLSVRAAVIMANDLFNPQSKMMLEIANKDDFEFNSGTGVEVFHKINQCKHVSAVYMYKPFNPFTKAMGYSDGKDIYINSRKIANFSFSDLVGLLCHEWLHSGPKFVHGNNYPSEFKNKHSVPYFVSQGVPRWL